MPSPESRKILIVDDEPAVRDAMRRSLASRGTPPNWPRTACRRAGDRPRRTEPDLIVLDVLMPRMDGLTAARRLRAAGSARADPDAHRPRHRRRPGHRAWTPAPTTTSSSRSSWTNSWPGSAPCCGAAPTRGRGAAGAEERPDDAGPSATCGWTCAPARSPGPAAGGADPYRVHAAGDVPRPPPAGAHPGADPQVGVGLRLRALAPTPWTST